MGRVCLHSRTHTDADTHTITIRLNWSERRRVDAASDILIQFVFFVVRLLPPFVVVEIPSFAVRCYVCSYAYHYYLNSSYFLRFSCLDSIVIALIVQISVVRRRIPSLFLLVPLLSAILFSSPSSSDFVVLCCAILGFYLAVRSLHILLFCRRRWMCSWFFFRTHFIWLIKECFLMSSWLGIGFE